MTLKLTCTTCLRYLACLALATIIFCWIHLDMSHFTYVATVHKSTVVTHSDVGSFTDEKDSNLIVAKGNHIEIYKLTGESHLQLLKDLPVNGTVATLKLLRPNGKTKDFLFLGIVTIKSRFNFYLLRWDACAEDVITSYAHDKSNYSGVVDEKMCTFNHDCSLVLLRTLDRMNTNYLTIFKLISDDDEVQLIEEFKLSLGLNQEIFFGRLKEEVLDVKLIFGSGMPTLAVVSQGEYGGINLKTYCVMKHSDGDNSDEDSSDGDNCKLVKGPWSSSTLDYKFLIPVPPPWGGVLAVGDKVIRYCSKDMPIHVEIKDGLKREYARSVARLGLGLTCNYDLAYERVGADGLRYLFSDQSGQLLLLVLTHGDKKVTELKLYPLGETSLAATLSYFHDEGLVFLGSSFGDSQLVKVNLQPDSAIFNPNLQMLGNFVNLGPISDFCVTESQREELVTCSGGFKCGSLRVIRKDFQLNEAAITEITGVEGIWSLKFSTDDQYDKFLVVNIDTVTLVYEIGLEDDVLLKVADIPSLDSSVRTLLCHNAVENLIIQVTPTSVRLVCLRLGILLNVWSAPCTFEIDHASARSTRVLLATGGGHLYFLEIIDKVLTLVKDISLEDNILCLDIGSNEHNPSNTKYAAVGTLNDKSVRIFSLPELEILTCDEVNEEFWPPRVLLCVLEGISYVFCATANGCVVYFILDTTTGMLTNKKSVSVCTRPVILMQFSVENTKYVFVAADTPTIIYSNFQNLHFCSVKHPQVNQICNFSCSTLPNSFAIVTGKKFIVETFCQLIRSIYLNEQALFICHHNQSETYAVLCVEYNSDGSEWSYIRLFDDFTFEVVDSVRVDGTEADSLLGKTVYGCCIASCVFLDDYNEYICVGTSESCLNQILVFNVEDRKLKLVSKTSKKFQSGSVKCMVAFNDMLLAGWGDKIEILRWIAASNGKKELKQVCEKSVPEHVLSVQSYGDFIFTGSRMYLYIYKRADFDDMSCEGKSSSDDEEPQQKKIKLTDIKAGTEEEINGNESESSEDEESESSDDEESESSDDEESEFASSDDEESEEVDDKSSEEGDETKTPKKKIQHDKDSLELLAAYHPPKTSVTAVHMFKTRYVGATTSGKLLTLRQSKGAGKRLQVVGRYRLGEKVTRFCDGPVLGDKEPARYFSTTSGAIGIVALLPAGGPYDIFDRLQMLINEDEGSWRLGYKGRKRNDSQYLDGDLISYFLALDCSKKAHICRQMEISVEEMERKIKNLTFLV